MSNYKLIPAEVPTEKPKRYRRTDKEIFIEKNQDYLFKEDTEHLLCPNHLSLLRKTDGRCFLYGHFPYGEISPEEYAQRVYDVKEQIVSDTATRRSRKGTQ